MLIQPISVRRARIVVTHALAAGIEATCSNSFCSRLLICLENMLDEPQGP